MLRYIFWKYENNTPGFISIHETKDKHIKSDSKNSKKKKKSSSNIILITQMWKCESVHTRI